MVSEHKFVKIKKAIKEKKKKVFWLPYFAILK